MGIWGSQPAEINYQDPFQDCKRSTKIGKSIRVLCLDGGGVRGLSECLILQAIEKAINCKICEAFDFIAGTSTGGIIAIAIGKRGLSVKDCTQIYSNPERIFSSTQIKGEALWDNKPLQKVLSHAFTNDQQIKDEKLPHVMVTAFNESTRKAHVIRSYNAAQGKNYTSCTDFTLAKAGLTTGSAPKYLDKVVHDCTDLEVNMTLSDGGLGNNNPTLLALQELELLFPGTPIELVVSVGTGLSDPKPEAPKSFWGWLWKGVSPYASRLSDAADMLATVATDSEHIHHVVEHQFKPDTKVVKPRYVRFNTPHIGTIDFTETRPAVIASMRIATQDYINSNDFKRGLDAITQLYPNT